MRIVVHLHNQLVLLSLQLKWKRVLIKNLFLSRFFRGWWGFFLAEWKYFDQIWELFGLTQLKVLYHRACFYTVWKLILIWFFGRGTKLFFLFSLNQHNPRKWQLYILIESNKVPFHLSLNTHSYLRHWKQVYTLIVCLYSSDTAKQCDDFFFSDIFIVLFDWLADEGSLLQLQIQWSQVLLCMQLYFDQLPLYYAKVNGHQVVLQNGLPFLWVLTRVHDLFQEDFFYQGFLLARQITAWQWFIDVRLVFLPLCWRFLVENVVWNDLNFAYLFLWFRLLHFTLWLLILRKIVLHCIIFAILMVLVDRIADHSQVALTFFFWLVFLYRTIIVRPYRLIVIRIELLERFW